MPLNINWVLQLSKYFKSSYQLASINDAIILYRKQGRANLKEKLSLCLHVKVQPN